MKPNFNELERDIYKYAKMVNEYAMKDVIKYAEDYIAMMWSYGRGLSYKVSVASDERDNYRLMFDWFGIFNPHSRKHEPAHSTVARYHERVIREALTREISMKYPNQSIEIQVCFPSK